MIGPEKLTDINYKRALKLRIYFLNAKVFIIDELYSVKTKFIQIINLRLQQIMGNGQRFCGLFVIIIGDPQQVIPVKGKPLFYASMYLK